MNPKTRKKRGAGRRQAAERIKKQAVRMRRKARKGIINVAYRAFFKSCYLIGLSFLIPFVLTYALPAEPEEISYTVPLSFFFVALFLVMLSFYGLLWRHKRLGRTFMSLGFMSLVPGLIAAFVYTIGRQRLVEGVTALQGGARSLALLDFYIDHTVPKLKVLVLAYIMLGLFFYWVGTKVE